MTKIQQIIAMEMCLEYHGKHRRNLLIESRLELVRKGFKK